MANAHIFEDGEVDEAWRAHVIAIRVGAAVADDIKTKLSLRRFDAAIGFAGLRPKAANLRLRIHDRAFGNVRERLLQNLQ